MDSCLWYLHSAKECLYALRHGYTELASLPEAVRLFSSRAKQTWAGSSAILFWIRALALCCSAASLEELCLSLVRLRFWLPVHICPSSERENECKYLMLSCLLENMASFAAVVVIYCSPEKAESCPAYGLLWVLQTIVLCGLMQFKQPHGRAMALLHQSAVPHPFPTDLLCWTAFNASIIVT